MMYRAALALTALAALGACSPEQEGKPQSRIEIGKKSANNSGDASLAEPSENSPCVAVVFEGTTFTDCIADPKKHRITTALSAKGKQPYRSFDKLATWLKIDGKSAVFAVNGGMFGTDGKPLGYYVENKQRLKELERGSGSGNFYMKPNGVFFGTGSSWRIRTTEDFFNLIGDRPEFGTQSGPMLVKGGDINSEFSKDGASRAVRNGVGVDSKGRAHFVKSEGEISFGKLARFFRDKLKTPNALYLDGTVSALWDPASNRMDDNGQMGPMIVVQAK